MRTRSAMSNTMSFSCNLGSGASAPLSLPPCPGSIMTIRSGRGDTNADGFNRGRMTVSTSWSATCGRGSPTIGAFRNRVVPLSVKRRVPGSNTSTVFSPLSRTLPCGVSLKFNSWFSATRSRSTRPGGSRVRHEEQPVRRRTHSQANGRASNSTFMQPFVADKGLVVTPLYRVSLHPTAEGEAVGARLRLAPPWQAAGQNVLSDGASCWSAVGLHRIPAPFARDFAALSLILCCTTSSMSGVEFPLPLLLCVLQRTTETNYTISWRSQ